MSQRHACHTAEFKARVALAALSGPDDGERTAREYGVSASQVNRWKRELMDNAPSLFGKNEKREFFHEAEVIDLFCRLAKLQAGRGAADRNGSPPQRS